ncbi:site-specific integrase [Paraburkholderia sp. C35]|uniref:tyrosine-type recombinase/integrase n=1 Tax=Paraburkholderia sp. C35 TaxID=2126993 RepID=UPI000D68A639|nr:site-specific integrase [Paraburkholderia sp. C35]
MKTTKALTAKVINDAKPAGKPYKLADLNRLYILVSVAGSKTWYWNYRLDGKDLSYAIGKWPEITIADARAARAAAEKLVEQGINPTASKKQAVQQTKVEQATTFGGIAQEWIDQNAADPANPVDKQPGKWSRYYSQQVRNFMGRYVINAPIGQRPIKSITSADIFQLVKSVGTRDKAQGDERKANGAPSIAVLIKQWSSAVFALAVATQPADSNPAEGFKVSLAVKKPKSRPNKALDENELRAVLSALSQYTVKKDGRKYAGQRDTCIAIELLLLTAVRTVELRKARWSEFNFLKAEWTIPGERMKMGLPHVVPLSTQAIALLQELRLINPPAKADGDGWLFPNRRRGSADCMSATTINRALGNMGFNGERAFRAHGARGTASTTLHGQDYDPLIVDSALAHKQKGVAGIYNQGKYLKQRRAMMQAYADHLDSLKTVSDEPYTVLSL